MDVDTDSIKLSVNRSPSSVAKEIYKDSEVPTVLIGDAALGLSYFKGLNAGIEQACQLSKTINLTDDNSQSLTKSLVEYNVWFKSFSEKKLIEMNQYYQLKINKPTILLKWVNRLLYGNNDNSILKNHYTFELKSLLENKSHKFLHRDYQPVLLGDFGVPRAYYIKK